MASTPTPWPPALAGTPAVSVIERAIDRQRLAHSLLLHGDDLDTLALVALGIADRLLNDPRRPAQTFPPESHPDFFALRPSGKARFITADNTRGLIGKVQVSPQISHRKIAVVYEADRMNAAAANIFLKTLEEPPGSTVILLLTTRPYALLPTIRSRCLHFRFPATAAPLAHPALPGWLADYQAWLGQLSVGVADKRVVADHIFAVYGLITRFNAILAGLTAAVWETQKQKLPPDLEEDEQVAIETGIANGIRQRLFIELEHATRAFAQSAAPSADPEQQRAVDRALVAAIGRLEHSASLLRLNLNEATALEDFLLASLRLWAKR